MTQIARAMQKKKKAQNDKAGKLVKKSLIPIDPTHIPLKDFFKSISKNYKVDADKLKAVCKATFSEFGDVIFALFKKALGGMKMSIDLKQYCTYICKFISMDMKGIKEMFMTMLDLNKDKKVCETDLFKTLQLI